MGHSRFSGLRTKEARQEARIQFRFGIVILICYTWYYNRDNFSYRYCSVLLVSTDSALGPGQSSHHAPLLPDPSLGCQTPFTQPPVPQGAHDVEVAEVVKRSLDDHGGLA